MIQIYGNLRSRTIRPVWACEELGLDYEVHSVGLGKGSDELRKLNPNLKIPVMVDGDITLYESAAICHYLATEKGNSLLFPEEQKSRALYFQWLFFAMSELDAALWMRSLHGGRASESPQGASGP